MIELIVFPRADDPRQINFSQFCSKTIIYLRLSGIDYSLTETQNPTKYPNKKLPVIMHSDKVIADSSVIESYCNLRFSVNLNRHLSDSEKATGHAFSKLIEEEIYWAGLCERWIHGDRWLELREAFFSSFSLPVRIPLAWIVRRQLRNAAMGQGMARHSYEEILRRSSTGFGAISSFLGDKEYFLGDSVSSYDSTVYGFLSNLLYTNFNPDMKQQLQSFDNLTHYCERMYSVVFSEKTK